MLRRLYTLRYGLLSLCVCWIALSLAWVPGSAQSSFATNTPLPTFTPPPDIFVINTPVPTPTATFTPPAPPAAPADRYALRLWLEADYVALLLQQIAALEDGGVDARLALRLTQYELQRRLPNAPRDPQRLETLVEAFVAAPRGAADMQAFVRPYIQAALNSDALDDAGTYNGFRVDVADANLDGRAGTDAIVRILYPAEATTAEQVIYNEFVPALRDENGNLRFVETHYALDAVPFGNLRGIALERIADVNRDRVDELVLRVDDGQVNQRLYIVGVRNGVATDLTRPGESIRFGQIVSWPLTSESRRAPDLTVLNLRAVSALPDWPCNSQQAFTWVYENNFYRPTTELNARYTNQNTLGCTLHEAEPLFALPPEDAIATVEAALSTFSLTSPAIDRALLTLAMLYVVQGRLDQAISTAQSVLPEDTSDTESWSARQATALIEAASISGNTALGICEALQFAGEAPACDMDALLGRYLRTIPLRTNTDLLAQLDLFSLPVLDSVLVEEIGRLPRTTMRFDIRNTGWWSFAAQRDGSYDIQASEPPGGFEPPTFPPGLLQAPASAVAALIEQNDPASVLAILETLERNNPGVPLAPNAYYLRALSYDFLGDRGNARSGYYDLWQRFPQSLWGELAARHLERRG